MKVIESNCQTGEVTERDMTPEEIAEILARQLIEMPVDKSVEQSAPAE